MLVNIVAGHPRVATARRLFQKSKTRTWPSSFFNVLLFRHEILYYVKIKSTFQWGEITCNLAQAK